MRTLPTIAITTSLILLGGCVPLDDSGFVSGTDLTGSVDGESFFYSSGGAEQVDDGYVVTLADTPEFDCNSFEPPPASYILISVSGIEDAPSTYDAAGNVFFNRFEDRVSAGEAATAGTVTVDAIDFGGRRIVGQLDASNANSDIFGNFDVDICF